MDSLQRHKDRMIEAHLKRRGIHEASIISAFGSVPREAFVPENLVALAYHDVALPIGEGQTISQPYIVAYTLAALRLSASDRVLEVGTGSGYAAAILGRIVNKVYTIERVPTLADSARVRLDELGFSNVEVVCGDGSLGLPQHAPYDAIAVAAGGPEVPQALRSQLVIGGRLVIPVGKDEESQVLMRITREDERIYREERLTDVRFVPLIGEQAWSDDTATEITRK